MQSSPPMFGPGEAPATAFSTTAAADRGRAADGTVDGSSVLSASDFPLASSLTSSNPLASALSASKMSRNTLSSAAVGPANIGGGGGSGPSSEVGTLWRRLRAENHAYQENFDELKKTHQRLQEKYQSLLQLQNSKESEHDNLKKVHNDLVGRWQEQLNERTREFEAFRRMLPEPEDADLIRMELLAQQQEADASKWRVVDDELFKMHAHAESLATELAFTKSELKRHMEDGQSQLLVAQTRHAEETHLLQSKVAALAQHLERAESDGHHAKAAAAERELREAQLRAQSLVGENDELRAALAAARAEHASERAGFERQMGDMKAELTALGNERAALQLRAANAGDQAHGLQRQLADAAAQGLALEKAAAQYRSSYEAAFHDRRTQLAQQATKFALEVQRLETQLAETRDASEESLAVIESQNAAIKELHGRTQATVSV